jgi:hypothetical protein
MENGGIKIYMGTIEFHVWSQPRCETGSDHMIPNYSFEKMFDIQIEWKEWSPEEKHSPSNSLIWYTGGSKTDSGVGAVIHGKNLRPEMYAPLGQHTTVFLA